MKVSGVITPSIRNLMARLEDVDVTVRWGGPQVTGAINGECHIADGLEQLRLFRAAGVSCPEFTEDRAQALAWSQEGKIVFGRKVNHTQGLDIRCNILPRKRGQRQWLNSDFFTLYQPSIREWRFHIFKGMCIGRAVKVGPPMEAPLIRSRRNGFVFDHTVAPPKGLRKLSKDAVAALSYDFGAVDVLELDGGSASVLEVNSRPGIRDEYTISAYCKAIRGYRNV